ncbi:MAG: hypothetical protein IJO59_06645 [Clostridia bacterium]|nr:hypothetical protein [Clostridia bacterium]
MKYVISLLLGVILLSSVVFAAPAADQVIKLTATNDVLSFVATEPTTFWESPTLRNGETAVTTGTLTLVNDTDITRDIYFDCVKFPYQDEHALAYLNHLFITVNEGETVLYDGAYSCINNENVKPKLGAVLAPHASCSYTITLRCDYTYVEAEEPDREILEWIFGVQAQPTSDFINDDEPSIAPSPLFDPLFVVWPIALVIAAILFVVVSRSKQ